MSNLAVLKLSSTLARQSLTGTRWVAVRSAGSFRDITGTSRDVTSTSIKDVPQSPFAKRIPDYATFRQHKKTPDEHFFKPLLTPEVAPPTYAVRSTDFARSFDRKDFGRKPKPLLEVKPIKFAVENLPNEYTHKPLKTFRTGGRHPVTGRVIYRRIGGGVYRDHHWIDTHRDYIPHDETIQEKILEIKDDPQRTAKIALVGHKDHQHWIVATEHMKVGQVVKSSRAVGRIAIRAFEGDTYAVGALPIGTVVSSVEVVEGKGATAVRAAGCSAHILKKEEGSVIIQLPSKQTIKVSENCMATVGRVSNVGWQHVQLGSAGATRRLGIRPKSGLWHRKDGYCGRKIHPAKPLRSYLLPKPEKRVEHAFSAWNRY